MRIIKRLILVLLLGVIAFIVIVNADYLVKPVFKNSYFDSQFLGTHYFINDLVGVSPKQSSLADAYLLSHSARAAVLIADEALQYQLIAADDFGLSQDPEVKGWGALRKPVTGKGVLQLYYYRTFLVGVFQPEGAASSDRSLQISVPWSAIYGVSGGVEVIADESGSATQFDIALNTAGRFWIETQPPPSDGFSITFSLQNFLPGEVLVGAEQVVMDKRQFSLSTRDLHSLALTELDGDAGSEFSVVRGGMRGRIGEIDPAATDLLVDSNNGKNITSNYPAFMKQGCPGRQSAWVDIDSDGDLDLYISCGRPKEPTELFPNQLFENTADGLIENGEKFGVDFITYGAFRYIDWDGDLDPDLWWADANGELQYYENRNTHFILSKTFTGTWQGSYRPPQLLIQDLTQNGSPDLLVTHPAGNRLIINQQGNSKSVVLSTWGLPDKTVAATWLDIDLDGKVDLLTALDGVYLNSGTSLFNHVRGEFSGEVFIHDARLVSFAGKDGRQFLLAYRSCLPGKLCGARRVALGLLRRFLPLELNRLESLGFIEPYDWYVYVLKRHATSGAFREVAITLQGTPYNPNALGGRVDLAWHTQKQSHWVAETESSLYSQGDLTMYASLPVSEKVSGLAVWPDSCKVEFVVPSEVRKLSVVRPATCR